MPVVQRAYAACLQNPQPCNENLAEAASQQLDDVNASWKNVETLLIDDASRRLALGAFDPKRIEADYNIVKEIYDVKAFKPSAVFTNDLLDKSIKAK
ncbi:hypothetical protein [Variovorax sp. GT1P44]|uniref:hypothetical protein n=1 Tax=Variovorax sp. GT1P44 TaxID=3443742 RepID=UPI003F47AD33